MNKHRIPKIAILLLALTTLGWPQSPELNRFLNLKGNWMFELGDNAAWSTPGFDDLKWDRIRVPSPWEEQGYPGYDGFAWYRKHFTIDDDARGRSLYLRLGYIDDVSEVFFNGHMIGHQGVFPPKFMTAYAVAFEFPIPKDFIRYGSENVIAVRVYDHYQAGGITHGDVGIYERWNVLEPDLDLAGQWKFKTGDNKTWAESAFDDSRWQGLKVPLLWDAQGYKDFDGIAWYRVKFKVSDGLARKRLILLLGRIDDMDGAYLNGELIGKTGRIRPGLTSGDHGTEYQRQRAYAIPMSLLKPNEENTLAVRVLDVWMHGGIYDGPIGLVTRDKYANWRERPRSLWDHLQELF
jgi:hypothetical protein